MTPDEFVTIQGVYRLGLDTLASLEGCLRNVADAHKLSLETEGVDRLRGELTFWFAGARYYVRIRITDRNIDDSGDVGTEYRVPSGWLDWGRFDVNDLREQSTQNNSFDERGMLCEVDSEEFYCDFTHCDDPRVSAGLMSKLNRLVGRTIALNNA